MRIENVKYITGTVTLDNHNHSMHQILFVTSGEMLVTVNGKEERLCEGCLFIISSLEEHSVNVLTDDCTRYVLLISSEPSFTGKDNYLLSSVMVNRTAGFRHVIDTGAFSTVFASIFSDMKREFDDERPFYKEQTDLLFKTFLIALYRTSPEIFAVDVKSDTTVVEKIQSRFESDYSLNFSLGELATEYHISISHLAHIFKAVTGYAPIDYLMACRLTAAKNFLASSTMPIKEIVDACGFGDESNFSRMFKAKVGMTPSAYRKLYL